MSLNENITNWKQVVVDHCLFHHCVHLQFLFFKSSFKLLIFTSLEQMNTSLQGIFIPPQVVCCDTCSQSLWISFLHVRENNKIFASPRKANGQPFHVRCLDSSQHIKTWLLSTCTYCMYRHNRLRVSAKEKSHQHLNFFKVNSSAVDKCSLSMDF